MKCSKSRGPSGPIFGNNQLQILINLYDKILAGHCRKLECDDLLFVEYVCPVGDEIQDVWSQYGHFSYIMSGKKIWITPEGELPIHKGDAVYCRKGAYTVRNLYDEDYCALLFFIPEKFIREIVLESYDSLSQHQQNKNSDIQILKLNVDPGLKIFFESVISFFFRENAPSTHLLKLKFKELVLQILTNNTNSELAQYFISLARENQDNLKQIVQNNFLYNLPLESFARLCNRSLSSFKRDFQKTFGMPPGKWLVEQRLKFAKMRLLTTEENINTIAFHSGFENTSHFIRSFKNHFGLPPTHFRQKIKIESH